MKNIKAKYSGKNSKLFWKKINSLKSRDQQEMYSLGVVLQNLEEYVLKQLNQKKAYKNEKERNNSKAK